MRRSARVTAIAAAAVGALLLFLGHIGSTAPADAASVRPTSTVEAPPIAAKAAAMLAPPATQPYDPSGEEVPAGCTPLVNFKEEVPDRCPQTGRILSRWIANPRVAERKTWTLIDVGGNKGYGVASLLDELRLAGRAGLGVDRTALALFRFGIGGDRVAGTACENAAGLCGSCCDCASWVEYDARADGVAAPPHDELPGTWHAFVFEPTRANSEFLMAFYGDPARVSLASKGKGQVTVYSETAASGVTELGQMPDVGLGTEFMSISNNNNGRTIQKITLDEAIPAAVEYVDVLMTDTEGHDYFVADGARRFLDAGRVGLYIFELWGKDRPLRQHLKRLEDAGMQCFVLVRPHNFVERRRTLARIESGCGSDRYFERFVGWQNALCVNTEKEPELFEVFKVLADTPQAPMPNLCEIPHFQPHTVTFASRHHEEPWAQLVLQRCNGVKPVV